MIFGTRPGLTASEFVNCANLRRHVPENRDLDNLARQQNGTRFVPGSGYFPGLSGIRRRHERGAQTLRAGFKQETNFARSQPVRVWCPSFQESRNHNTHYVRAGVAR